MLACVVLLGLKLSLTSLLMLAHQNRLLDLGLFNTSLFPHLIDALTGLGRDHLIILHFLHFLGHLLIVPLLKLKDLLSSLARLVDLLPSFDFFLL